MHTKEFFQSSQKIVQDFLSSVIAIDDNLFFDARPNPTDVELEDESNFDGPQDETSGLGYATSSESESTIESAAPLQHPLDYQDLSLAFADYGINCCAFKPDSSRFETIDIAAEKIVNSVRRADITILDWSMDEKFGKHSGTLAKLSINKILQADKEQHGRLRLIVIYTGEPNPEEIAQNILADVSSLDANASLNKNNINFKNTDLEFCQITVIKKKTDAKELRDEVVALFTELTIGLLSNATLSAIGELRDNTHHILHTFNKHLDPAYLSHVIGLLSSSDVREKSHEIAFDYATDLISEEFKSNLQISHVVKENLGLSRLQEWADYINPAQTSDFFEIKIGDAQAVGVESERLKNILACTADDEDDTLVELLTSTPAILKREREDKKTLENFSKRKIQLNLKATTYLSHENLSAIECKRRDVLSLKKAAVLPTIKQGSIVKITKNENDKETNQYYICMQPLCDSVRIKNATNFIFLEIEAVAEGKEFTHLLRDSQGNFIKFKIKPSSKGLQIFNLVPDTTSNTVKTIFDNKEYKVKFKTDSSQDNFLIWLGELKTNIAQSIANKLAEQISRVGLDTNEWLRLSSSSH